MECTEGFKNGLFKPSKLSFWGSLIVAGLWAIWSIWFFTLERYNSGMGKYLARNTHDDRAFLPERILSLEKSGDEKVIILGASGFREAVYSEKYLEMKLREMGKTVSVAKLASSAQTLEETLVILEHMGETIRGLVLVDLSFARLLKRKNSYALGIRTPTSDAEELTHNIGIHFVDNWRFYAGRIAFFWWNTFLGAQSYVEHHYVGQGYNPPEDLELSLRDDYKGKLSKGFEVLDRIIEQIKLNPNLNVVFVKALYNPAYRRIARKEMGEIDELLDSYLNSRNVKAIDPNSALTFEEDQFADKAHLRSEMAMRYYTDWLATAIAPFISQRDIL